jgi:hypothetical protein
LEPGNLTGCFYVQAGRQPFGKAAHAGDTDEPLFFQELRPSERGQGFDSVAIGMDCARCDQIINNRAKGRVSCGEILCAMVKQQF